MQEIVNKLFKNIVAEHPDPRYPKNEAFSPFIFQHCHTDKLADHKLDTCKEMPTTFGALYLTCQPLLFTQNRFSGIFGFTRKSFRTTSLTKATPSFFF